MRMDARLLAENAAMPGIRLLSTRAQAPPSAHAVARLLPGRGRAPAVSCAASSTTLANDYDRIEGHARIRYRAVVPAARRFNAPASQKKGRMCSTSAIGTGVRSRAGRSPSSAPTGRLVGVDPEPLGCWQEVKLAGVELCQLPALRGGAAPDRTPAMISSAWAMRCGTSPDVFAAFAEFYRVLRPGGRLLVLVISKPAGRIGTAVLKALYARGRPPLARSRRGPTGLTRPSFGATTGTRSRLASPP